MNASRLPLSRVKRNGRESTAQIAVLGGGHVGAALARHLDDEATTIVFLDPDPAAVERAGNAGVTAHEADTTSVRDLDRHDVDGTDLAVVASDDDGSNLLAAQLLRVQFDVEHVVVRVNDPRNVDSFADCVETVCATSAVADALGTRFDADVPDVDA